MLILIVEPQFTFQQRQTVIKRRTESQNLKLCANTKLMNILIAN